MGVRGLQSFLKKNKHLSQRLELLDTVLLIDASNLKCHIYDRLCRGKDSQYLNCDKYGCDMVAYGQEVRQFFKSLDKCHITPILVYDGSVIGKQSTQDQLVLKDKETHRRGLDRFEKNKQAIEDSNKDDDSFLFSLLLSPVFKSVIHDLGIQTIQAPYEADTHLASLANDYKCPILTNDSDFIIYPLPVGFVMLDFFHYKQPEFHSKLNRYYIECVVYSHEKLMKQLPGLKLETMPLLSILLGNDYTAAGTFDQFTDPICRCHYSGTLYAETFNHRKIANLLEWLKGKSIARALEYIVDSFKSDSKGKVRKLIGTLLHSYDIGKSDNFQAELEEIYPNSQINTDLKLTPAAYLSRVCPLLPGIALDMIFHNTHYSYCMIDDLKLPPSGITVNYRPYSLAITLLRPRTYEGMTTNQRQAARDRDALPVFDRENGEYTMKLVRPMEHLENFGSLEHLTLYSTINLEPALKKSMLFSAFRFNAEELNLITDTLSQVFKEPFIHESRICLLLVKYVGIETKLSPKPQFVDGLMLTFFFYAALEGKLHDSLTKQNNNYGQLLLKLKPHTIMNNGLKYDLSPILFRRINHFISQLQNAFHTFNLINCLLDFVLPHPRTERYFNGTLIFRLTKALRIGDMKMRALCSNLGAFLDVCDSIKIILHTAE